MCWKAKKRVGWILVFLLGGLIAPGIWANAQEAPDLGEQMLRVVAVDVSTDTEEYARSHEGWVNLDTTFTVTVHTERGESSEEAEEAAPPEPGETMEPEESEEAAMPEPEVSGGDMESEENPEESGDLSDLPELPGEEASVQVVAACVKNDESWEDAVLLEGTNDGDVWTFSFREEDELFEGVYRFAVYDSLENGKAKSEEAPVVVEFKKDKVLPSLEGMEVEYHTDTGMDTGRHSFSEAGAKNTGTLFARNEMEAVLYVKDCLSGIHRVDGTLAGEHYTAEPFTGPAENRKVPEHENVRTEPEEQVTPLKVTFRGDQKGRLQIDRIMDVAGNELVLEQPLAGGDLLVVDGKAPELSVDYGKYENEAGGKRFYRGSEDASCEDITLTFKEQYFRERLDEMGTPIKPEIRMKKNGMEVEKTDVLDWISWEAYDESTGEIKAKLALPYESSGEETEYQIFACYADGAGNSLTWRDGLEEHFGTLTAANGYESGILALDPCPPLLAACEILGEAAEQEGEARLYRRQEETDDVHVQIAIRENAAYWNRDAVELLVMDREEQRVIASNDPGRLGGELLHGLAWDDQEALHMASFGFDGEPHRAACYEVRVFYQDLAGNVLLPEIHVPVSPDSSEPGAYVGEPFILDHAPPVFQIFYNEAFQSVDGTAYYGGKEKEIAITVCFAEEYPVAGADAARPGGLKLRVNGQETAVSWSKEGNVYTGICGIDRDGDYTVSASGQDAAGNKMEAGAVVQRGRVQKGSYLSLGMTLDTVAPVITMSYSGTPVNIWGERKYFQEDTALRVRIQDQNMGCGDFKEVLMGMEVTDITGEPIRDSLAEQAVREMDGQSLMRGEWEVEIPLVTDGNYRIPIAFTDLAGNSAEFHKVEEATKDAGAPTELTLTHTPEHPVNYKPFGYLFAGAPMTVQAGARDQIAGIHRIRYTLTDEQGVTEVKETLCPPWEYGSYELTLPEEKEDFKGTVLAEVFDWCGNRLEEKRSYLVESEAMHEACGRIACTILTEPGRIVDGEPFWNTDVELGLSMEDSYSGIGSYSYQMGSSPEETVDFQREAGKVLTDGEKTHGITEQVDLHLTLEAAKNNENDVKLLAEYRDNAGHREAIEQSLHVDITVPVVTVEYDRNDPSNGQFYHQPRTATVVIRERNFREEDVEWIITERGGAMPGIGEWTTSGEGDETTHTCQVVFDQDGEYTFTVAFEDLAGNRSVYDRVDTFIIDQTRPELTVTYDKQDGMHGKYYRQSRTAAIHVLEPHFDPGLLDVNQWFEGEKAPVPVIWHNEGDEHTAFVTFSEDGNYVLEVSGRDQADNPMESYESEPFVIDRTEPEILIFGVEEHSANNDAVTPVVRYTDRHPDADQVRIQLTGYGNGPVELHMSRKDQEEGAEFFLEDLPHLPELDDLYTLKVTACDLAGNESEVEWMYSVNRFGSVYTFDGKTQKLLGEQGSYYTKEAPTLVVTETNVDTLEFREITCSLDGDLRTLEEGKDYVVQMSGEERTWKQYTYRIDSRNFEEEGTYILTIYSEDRADNASDNHTKGKRMEFAVDRTAPTVLLSGVEDKGRYRESSREITLDVQDNVRLKEVQVILNGVETVYPAEALKEMEDRLAFLVESENDWQTLKVIATDMAGNQKEMGEIEFLVTPNFFAQFVLNTPLFSASLIILSILFICTVIYFCEKRENRKIF